MGASLTVMTTVAAGALPETPGLWAQAALVATIGLGLTVLFVGFVWHGLKRDWEPVMGRAVTRPRGLSAATLRFIRTGRFDAASLTSALLTLAAKGAVAVEHETKSVRLRKVVKPLVPLTRAENRFAAGLMHLRSTLLVNQNAGPALALGAATLQKGVGEEWHGYQAGRLRRQLLPAFALAVIGAGLAAPLAHEPVRFLLTALALGVALILMGRFVAGLIRSVRHFWQDPWLQTCRFLFDSVAIMAALGTSWMVLVWNGGGADALACGVAGGALAVPFWAHRVICASRRVAGPVRGRIEALRNQLLSRAQGIDEIGAAAATPEGPDAEVAMSLWVADAIALDAASEPPTGPVARLETVFDNPERVADALRAFVPETTLDQFEPMSQASSDS